MFRKFENLVDPNASMKAEELVMEIMEYLQVSSSSIPDCDDDKPAGNNTPEFSEDKKSKDNTIIDASKEGAGYDMDSFAQKNVDSQSTLKLPSDNSTQGVDNQQHINDSQSTIKLTSDESSNKIQSNDGNFMHFFFFFCLMHNSFVCCYFNVICSHLFFGVRSC